MIQIMNVSVKYDSFQSLLVLKKLKLDYTFDLGLTCDVFHNDLTDRFFENRLPKNDTYEIKSVREMMLNKTVTSLLNIISY
jgi:hypothetical protein